MVTPMQGVPSPSTFVTGEGEPRKQRNASGNLLSTTWENTIKSSIRHKRATAAQLAPAVVTEARISPLWNFGALYASSS